MNSIPDNRESVWWIESIPQADVRHKMHKVNALNQDLYAYFLKLSDVPALATSCLCLFYLVASYVPSVIITALLSMLGCKGRSQDLKPSSDFLFNQADMVEIKQILKLVKEIDSKTGGGSSC